MVEQIDGPYERRFDASKGFTYEGVFFKEWQTDFDSGIFSFAKDAIYLKFVLMMAQSANWSTSMKHNGRESIYLPIAPSI
ncbi:hypothetical protein [Shouchella tritolerans]|uniref:hypothetical protein n=1 Tax=Shouchella tritolerans TaxID=2979466 RepID=UPI00078807B9|nr:hypothetical protein [Shouchella tritolerans]